MARMIGDENELLGAMKVLTASYAQPDEQRHERPYREREKNHLNNVAKRQIRSSIGLLHVEVAHIVKENRRCVTQRIDSIQHASVAGNHTAEVLHTEIAFDRAHHRAA